MALATAWFKSTMGLGDIARSTSYSARIWRQSVASAVAASSCRAAMAACSWYGPSRPSGSVWLISATPSAIAA